MDVGYTLPKLVRIIEVLDAFKNNQLSVKMMCECCTLTDMVIMENIMKCRSVMLCDFQVC